MPVAFTGVALYEARLYVVITSKLEQLIARNELPGFACRNHLLQQQRALLPILFDKTFWRQLTQQGCMRDSSDGGSAMFFHDVWAIDPSAHYTCFDRVTYNKNMNSRVHVEDITSWSKWQKGLCDNCQALCCTMPVELRLPDLLRLGLVSEFELDDEPKLIAKRLMKQGAIAHFNHKQALFTLAQHSSGACCYLDLGTRRCTVYELRPDTCRRHPQVGPRPGYCAYRRRT